MGAKCLPYIDVNDMQEFTWGEMYGVGGQSQVTFSDTNRPFSSHFPVYLSASNQ